MSAHSTSRPATPEEKLYTRRAQASEFGKEFDENRERKILGLPEVDDPVIIAESPERRRLARAEDSANAREMRMAKEAAAAAAQDIATENAALKAQLDAMQAQIAQLMGDREDGNAPTPITAKAEAGVAIEGPPTTEWSVAQLKAYLKQEEFEIPTGGVAKQSRQALAQWVIDRYNEREEAAAAMAATEGEGDGGDATQDAG